MNLNFMRDKSKKEKSALLFALSLLFILSTVTHAVAQNSISSRQVLLKEKGRLQSISLRDRSATIDGRTFQLSEDLTVKDKSDRIMLPEQYGSLSFVDVIEFTRIKGTSIIKEIKIIRYAS